MGFWVFVVVVLFLKYYVLVLHCSSALFSIYWGSPVGLSENWDETPFSVGTLLYPLQRLEAPTSAAWHWSPQTCPLRTQWKFHSYSCCSSELHPGSLHSTSRCWLLTAESYSCNENPSRLRLKCDQSLPSLQILTCKDLKTLYRPCTHCHFFFFFCL